MKNALILLLILVVIVFAAAKLKHDYSTFYRSKANPLGKLTMIENHLTRNGLSKFSDQNGFIREFGIPCRLITYRDIETRGTRYDYDLIVLLVDDKLRVRGVIGDFVPKVTIAPEIGPAELLMARLWQFIDKEDPAIEMNRADPRELEPKEHFEFKVTNGTLDAKWLRWRENDRVVITTRISEAETSEHGRINDYLSMMAEKKLLAAEYADLRKKRSGIAKSRETWEMEKRLKRVYEKGRKLRSELKNIETELPPEVVTAVGSDFNLRTIVSVSSVAADDGGTETVTSGRAVEDEMHSPLDSFKFAK